jgi:hypothetical protein
LSTFQNWMIFRQKRQQILRLEPEMLQKLPHGYQSVKVRGDLFVNKPAALLFSRCHESLLYPRFQRKLFNFDNSGPNDFLLLNL